jgi:hypothetical protein
MPLDRRRSDGPIPRIFVGLVLGFVLASCSEPEVPPVGFSHPTLVEVSPDAFLGSVPCLPSPGAMRRYVATVYDLPAQATGDADAGTDTPGFALPSSTVPRGDGTASPIPCTQEVGFSHIIQDHRYWAEIDGYDRDDLLALAPGTRVLYDPATLERIEPRWTTSCAKNAPIKGVSSAVRSIGSCDALADSKPGGEALVEVRVDDALDGQTCGSEAGEVERFDVTPPGGAPLGAACGETVTLAGLEPGGAVLSMPLRAFEAGASEPTWGTTCVADVVQGVTTSAECLPLSSEGALEVDPLDALAALELECDALAFAELDVEMTDGDPDPRHVDPSSCSGLLHFQGREPGLATARASARFADGTRSAAALCSATLVPGETTRAVCAREP